ncbi:MAG: MarR family transcriptional regulator [Fimbriimonadaceae bacterium]|nr:MarR family transcriptional regulator [Alphaproteobacteria bacterium]
MESVEIKPGELAPGISLDDFLPYLINRISNRLNMDLSASMKSLGITIPYYRILSVLNARNGSSIGEIVVYTMTEQSTVSKLIGRMESNGLVERRPDPSDGRIVNIHLCQAGREALAKIRPLALTHYLRAIEGIDKEEQKSLIGTLHKVLDNIRVSDLR